MLAAPHTKGGSREQELEIFFHLDSDRDKTPFAFDK